MDPKIGFRPLFTNAPLTRQLRAAPGAYDAAPIYLVHELAEASPAIKQQLATFTPAEELTGTRTLGKDAVIALQLVAPIGFNIVRVMALGKVAAGLLINFNPVTAILAGPALFFTGKRMITDLRRAFVVDPKVRALIQRADALSARGEHKRAACVIKEALEQDIDPTYGRNGDLYLQLGLAQMAAGSPRAAMIAFAKASVLFTAKDAVPVPRDGRKLYLSKRGLAELMAIAAIDSFIRDDKRLEEWDEVVGDFATSAHLRLQEFARRKEDGHVFGLFGVDDDSAELCREFMAKLRFLVAKTRLATLSASEADEVELLVEEALDELYRCAIEPEELFVALMEQATFYAELSRGHDATATMAAITVRLMGAAADAISERDPVTAARVHAEITSFISHQLPRLSPTEPAVAKLQEAMRHHVMQLEDLSARGQLEGVAFAHLIPGWSAEQQYRLTDDKQARKDSITRSWEAYMQAGEPACAIRSALRLAWLADDQASQAEALGLLVQSGQSILESQPDPVSVAFAARYVLDAVEVLGRDFPSMNRERSAELFLEASRHVRSSRIVVPFHLHGEPIVHPAQTASVVLEGLAAQEFGRAGQGVRAMGLLETVRTRAGEGLPPVVASALELEHAELLIALGDTELAAEKLEEIERNARVDESPEVQRRALELMNRIRKQAAGLDTSGLPAGRDVPDKLLQEPMQGLANRYAQMRDDVLQAGETTRSIVQRAGLADKLRHNDNRVVDAIGGRLQRLRDHVFRVAVVGDFSSGKSTLLNAMLGRQILPTAVRPTTATVNRIRFAEQQELEVLFLDGHSEQVNLRELKAFTTERGNPRNEKQILEVRLAYPIDMLRNGVEIIDTPGLSSLIDAHTATTQDILPTCDAVILMATGRQPFGESTRIFLEQLHSFVDDKIFYLLNKIDQLEPSGVSQAISFAEERTSSLVRGAKVFPVAAYWALTARRLEVGELDQDDIEDDPRLGEVRDADELLARSAIPELECQLGAFLEESRGLPLLREVATALLELLSQAEHALTVEVKAARMSSRELESSFAVLAREHETRKLKADQKLEGLRDDLQRRLNAVLQGVAATIPELTDPIMTSVPLTAGDIGGEQEVAAYQERLSRQVRAHLEHLLTESSRELSNAMADHRVEARKTMRELQRELRTEFNEVLALDGSILASDAALDLRADIASNVVLDSAGSFAIGGVLGFLGAVLLGPVGVVLSVIGSTLLGGWFSEQKVAAASDKVRDGLDTQLVKLASRVETALRDAVAEAQRQANDEIAEHRDSILAEFDAQLATLLEQQETDEEGICEKQAMLVQLQADAVKVRRRLVAVQRA